MTSPTTKPAHRQFQGLVVSDKMEKTIVVRVDTEKKHPKYHKFYTTSRRYQVHDEAKAFHVGDTVTFEECRPLSRHKRWRVVGKVGAHK